MVRPPSVRPRAPLVVRVAGRWFQALAGIFVMLGLGAGEAVLKFRGRPAIAFATFGAFLAGALLIFFVGRGVVLGRRWAWRCAAVLAGTLLVLLFYASALGTRATMAQRTTAIAMTGMLFGVPLVLLGLPKTRAFFARREAR
jgi:hypothetical protein